MCVLVYIVIVQNSWVKEGVSIHLTILPTKRLQTGAGSLGDW